MSAVAIAAPLEARLDRGSIATLAGGHACVDLCQGAVPALLPFLIVERGLSLAAAAALITASTIGSSLVQPLFGLWSDRLGSPVLLPAGVAVGSVGLGVAGLVPSFGPLAAVLVFGGLGVAAFHPEGARYAGLASGRQRSRGMSYFAVGGNAGFALGPALVTPLVATLGLGATPLLALPGLAVSVLLAARLGRLRDLAGTAAPARVVPGAAQSPDAWRPLSLLVGAAISRTTAFFALQAFVPVFLIRELGASTTTAGLALTTMLLAGALGTLVGGRWADRIGRRRLLVASMIPLVPLLVLLPQVGLPAAFVVLAGIGFAVDSPFSTTIVLGQDYLPRHAALSSGITYGLAIGLGGLAAAGLGALADATSTRTVLEGLPILALAAGLLAASLPRTPALRPH